MGPIAKRFDVTGAVPTEIAGGAPQQVTAWLFVPDEVDPSRPVPVVVQLPGGTYDKRYFHMEIEGHEGYSQSEYLAAQGCVALSFDNYGIGESSRPAVPAGATRHVVAAAHHAAALQIFEQARAGTLTDRLPPLPDIVTVGLGHSMGAMLTIVQQAAHATYDRVALLGYSAIGPNVDRGGAKATVVHQEKDGYRWVDRSSLRRGFHWEDVPDAVVEADTAVAAWVPTAISSESTSANLVVEDAGRIACPIYFGVSERDVSRDPWAESGYFRGTREFMLQVLPRAGHCQSFAGTRHSMWSRIASFAHLRFD